MIFFLFWWWTPETRIRPPPQIYSCVITWICAPIDIYFVIASLGRTLHKLDIVKVDWRRGFALVKLRPDASWGSIVSLHVVQSLNDLLFNLSMIYWANRHILRLKIHELFKLEGFCSVCAPSTQANIAYNTYICFLVLGWACYTYHVPINYVVKHFPT